MAPPFPAEDWTPTRDGRKPLPGLVVQYMATNVEWLVKK